jgi:murein DD-endopeptidase MepM/ murein hydrolase activator NlpD
MKRRRFSTTIALVLFASCTSACGGALVISDFGDLRGPEGFMRRDGPHNGIDVRWLVGSPVIAVADGVIVQLSENNGGCGNMIVISHAPGDHISVYCHLDTPFKRDYGPVKRGEVIALLGSSGMPQGKGYEHVHLTIRRGGVAIDPMTMIAGCFDPKKTYPNDRLVLTYPVPC